MKRKWSLNFILNFQGVAELTPEIRRWIYLGTVFAPKAIPLGSYALIVFGAFLIIFVFVDAYKNFVFTKDPTLEILEMGRKSIRRGSSFLAHQQQRFSIHRETQNSYSLLKSDNTNNNDGENQT